MNRPYQQRLQAVRRQFDGWGVEALLVTSRPNCRWLSGFSGSAASLLISAHAAVLATDARYWEQARDQAPDFELYEHRRRPQDDIAFLRSAAAQTIGFEANHVTVEEAEKLSAVEGLHWQPLNDPIAPLRCRKTEEELRAIRAAAAITDATMSALPQMAALGISEKELAWQLEKHMRERGAEGMAFPPIVAFGANSARPHHTPGYRRLQAGDILLVDMGARLNGYCSDLTRTFYTGEQPDQQFAAIYALVRSAQSAAIEGLRAGIDTRDAHNLAANVIAAGGYGDQFTHGLGHALGLEIHEQPFLSDTRPAQELVAGTVLTIEPGIYLPGWGGVRIEDLVVLTAEGAVSLSFAPYAPMLPLAG